MHSYLKNNVFLISFGTSLSKLAGCIRQIFMNNRIIEFDPLIEGVLIKRYKRFLADIKLESGEVVTAHCANTGPMKGLLNDGAKVRISVSPSPCLLYTSPSPRDAHESRMPSSA